MSASGSLLRIPGVWSANIKRQPKPDLKLSSESTPVRPADTAVALGLVTRLDLLRLKTLARLYARGLPPDADWEDLLQEALTRVLVGSRTVPADVPPVAFIAGVMRSLRSEHRRRHASALREVMEPQRKVSGSGSEVDFRDESALPERVISARQEIARIWKLFADDAVALGILEGIAEGLEPEQIRMQLKITSTAYGSARRRMRRALLREGLASCLDK